jgi:membrane associated rhomboid family serine protease
MIPLKDNIPTDRFPVVTVALIAINVFVYFVLQKGGILHGPSDGIIVRWGAIPYELTHPGKHCDLAAGGQVLCQGQPGVTGTASSQPDTYLTVLSSMFMHGSILHLAGNMLFLWIFGNNVEDSMGRGEVLGRIKYLIFYLLGGAAAVALQTAIRPDAAVPTVGASGAIAAVLGAYIVLYPRARVLTVIFIIFFFTIFELPAVIVLGLWFVQQAIFGAVNLTDPTGGGGGVAYFAHVGGFAFGLLAIRLLAVKVKQVPPRYPVY